MASSFTSLHSHTQHYCIAAAPPHGVSYAEPQDESPDHVLDHV